VAQIGEETAIAAGFVLASAAVGMGLRSIGILPDDALFQNLVIGGIILVGLITWYIRFSVKSHLRSLAAVIFQKYQRPWLRQILGMIRSHPSGIIRDVVSAFFDAYAQEEANHLSGTDGETSIAHERDAAPPDRHRMYTSFVSYATLVRKVVVAALKAPTPEQRDLVCYASLAMPFPQWFNNKVTDGEFPYSGSDEVWGRYLELMYELAHDINKAVPTPNRKRDLKIYRFIQVYNGEGPTPRLGKVFRGEEEMKRWANAKILLPAEPDGSPNYKDRKLLVPFDSSEIQSILNEIPSDSALKTFITNSYGASKRAYVIIPGDRLDLPTPIKGHAWVRVIDAFRYMFCPDRYESGFVCRITDEIYDRYFKNNPAMPHDFFFVGVQETRGEDAIDKLMPLLCFSARIDSECQMARLEYATTELEREKNLDRINTIVSFISGRQPDCVEIGKWAQEL
jgi:hypothetical protein